MAPKALLTEALRLSPEERAALAGELIQNLVPEVDADAEAAWSAEIRPRLARWIRGWQRPHGGRRLGGELTRRPDVARTL
jgi:hypothetical protein